MGFILPTVLTQQGADCNYSHRPASLNNAPCIVTVIPAGEATANLNSNILFSCIPTAPIRSVQWYLNDSALHTTPDNIAVDFVTSGNGLGTLRFKEVLSSNNLTRG